MKPIPNRSESKANTIRQLSGQASGKRQNGITELCRHALHHEIRAHHLRAPFDSDRLDDAVDLAPATALEKHQNNHRMRSTVPTLQPPR